MEVLQQEFSSRDALVNYVQELCPWATGEESPIRGGALAAREVLDAMEPIRYGWTRNYGDGNITRLSPYIRYGVLSLNEVRNRALEFAGKPEQVTKFIQELAWRDFWQRLYTTHPQWIWEDIESYKTGFRAEEYAAELPEDIAEGRTGIACLDQFIAELIRTGYLHNHARMYLASYVVHYRRVRWQAGARWFLHHLLDGDPASNNLSWQWVASTFSNKAYLFNLENVDKYFGKIVDTSPMYNQTLDASYEELSERLFSRSGRER